MNGLIAQRRIDLFPGTITDIGDVGGTGSEGARFARILSIMIGLITIIAFVYFMFILISGAIGIMSAGGDKGKLEDARGRITSGVIGVVVVVAGMFIMDLIARLLGIDGILNIEAMLDLIDPPG